MLLSNSTGRAMRTTGSDSREMVNDKNAYRTGLWTEGLMSIAPNIQIL